MQEFGKPELMLSSGGLSANFATAVSVIPPNQGASLTAKMRRLLFLSWQTGITPVSPQLRFGLECFEERHKVGFLSGGEFGSGYQVNSTVSPSVKSCPSCR
jgi:hypothetical protein